MGPNRLEGLLYPCVRRDLLTQKENMQKEKIILNSGTFILVVHGSVLKRVGKSIDFGSFWSDQKKSEKNRGKIVVLTRNSVRGERGDNKYTKVEKAKFTYEKNDRLVEKQEKDRYKVNRVVEGGRVMRTIDKEAVRNRYNVKIAQKNQRVGGVEAVEKCEKDRDKVEKIVEGGRVM